MAKILVAASPEAQVIVGRILAGHDLIPAETMAQAKQTLQERTFDLIICTIAFDDSKMLDFLQVAKSMPEAKHTPFICAKVRPKVLRSPTALETLAYTCQELGSVKFLNITDYNVDPEREMREAIEQFLD